MVFEITQEQVIGNNCTRFFFLCLPLISSILCRVWIFPSIFVHATSVAQRFKEFFNVYLSRRDWFSPTCDMDFPASQFKVKSGKF